MMTNEYRNLSLLKKRLSVLETDASKRVPETLLFAVEKKKGRIIIVEAEQFDIDKLILASLYDKNPRATQFAKPVLFSAKYLQFLQHCNDYIRFYIREKLAIAYERSTKQGTDVPSVLSHLMSELCKSPLRAPDTISLSEINKQVSHSFHVFSETYSLFILSFKKRYSQSRDRFMFEVWVV
jgi:hypothetical protein